MSNLTPQGQWVPVPQTLAAAPMYYEQPGGINNNTVVLVLLGFIAGIVLVMAIRQK